MYAFRREQSPDKTLDLTVLFAKFFAYKCKLKNLTHS